MVGKFDFWGSEIFVSVTTIFLNQASYNIENGIYEAPKLPESLLCNFHDNRKLFHKSLFLGFLNLISTTFANYIDRNLELLLECTTDVNIEEQFTILL